jgi:hypothetical protein
MDMHKSDIMVGPMSIVELEERLEMVALDSEVEAQKCDNRCNDGTGPTQPTTPQELT